MKGIYFGILLVGVSASAVARPELNAFINKPANTIPELLAQIKSDKSVADRFMRHFSMTKGEVVEFVSSLRLGTLKKSGYYTIYSAPENGILKAHVSFFKKGTPAFVDANGEPILRVKCANPYVRGPVKAYASATPSVIDTPETIVASSVPVVASANIPTPAIENMTPATPVITETIPSGPLTMRTAPLTRSGSGQIFNAGGAIAGLGAAAVALNRPGGPAPVPEPASMIAIGIGAAALIRKRKKK
jgi:hypothetical protein